MRDYSTGTKKRRRSARRELQISDYARLAFFVYLLLLFLIVAVKFQGSFSDLSARIDHTKWLRTQDAWNFNVIPFATIGNPYTDMTFFWGNILAFIPLGFLLPAAFKVMRKWYRSALVSFFIILAIECFQLVTLLGSFDIDDISLNLVGSMIGYVIFYDVGNLVRYYERYRQRQLRQRKRVSRRRRRY